jgi:ATP-dependent helicase/nuclease subunit A
MADSRALDAASRQLIRKELLTNVLVEAGAGSGKTQMLAERMAAGIAAGVYQVEHMAAVTFTRKAASELRGRFHLALEKELADARAQSSSKETLARSARVQAALSNLERFFPGTIHSFCARLLRERPVESGVSPGFTELDEVQDLELRRRSWRDFITSARAAGDPDMMALLAADIRPGDLDPAFGTICENEDVEFPPGDAACPDPKAAVKALEKFVGQLEKHLPSKIDPDTTCKIQEAARDHRALWRVVRYRLDRPSVVASLLAVWECESRITQNRWADSASEKRRLRDLIQPLHAKFRADVADPYLSQWRQYVYRLSVKLLTRARDFASTERRRLNSLNYGDLLNLTARVLRENENVRAALQDKFRHILVDEFQDTDPVQAEILFWLAEASHPDNRRGRLEPARDWRNVPLRPGALFVVGDPKQSIYRFRRADIDTYNIVRHRFENPAAGVVVPLTMNFRSVPSLCKWANDVFETRFPEKPTQHAPRFAALDPKEGKTKSGGVFTLTHTCERDEVQGQDADRIARYIRSEVDSSRRRFSDFLILTRKKKDRIAPYASALEALNIPIEVSGAGAFGESAEVEALTGLLRALADPQDALALVTVLRGPLCGLSDGELFAFKQAGGWFSVFHDLADDGKAPPSRAYSALNALRQYYRWTRVLPAAAALERILEDSGYLALAATTPGGVDAGDLLHAVDRVRQVVEEGGSLSDAADALEADSEPANEVESLTLQPGRTDVVRLMNLHKAKGLEADVVFLTDPLGGFSPRVDVHIERADLKARGWLRIVRKSEYSYAQRVLGVHVDWPAHEAAELPYLEAEEDRLLYVAATRPREMLVVSRWLGNHKYPAWGVLNGFLGSARELSVPASAKAPAVTPLDSKTAAQNAAIIKQTAAYVVANTATWAVTSVTAEARHVARITRSVDASADDPSKVVTTDTPAHRADAGQAWGTLIHGLLEHAMRHPSATREDLRRLAVWLTVEEPQLRLIIEEALDTVERAAKAEFWQLAKSHERSVETPFVVSDGNQLTAGVIDLLYETPEGWQVIDYKTDLALAADAYTGQLDAYRAALLKVGCAVTDAAVVSVRSSGQ